ncbi:MAG: 30S ribosomal protein S20 [Alphaproteobacteria bacterium]
MPNIASARKRVRQTRSRTIANRSRMSRVRTAVRKVEEAIAAGDKTAAQEALKQAEPKIMRGVSKKIIHKRTGARQVSRLSARIKVLSG